MKRMCVACLIGLVLLGCTLGKDYSRPAVDSPAAWRFEEKEVRDTANTAWWEQFQDPTLNELIAASLASNRDVQIAAARIEEYMGRYGTTRADLFPQVGVGADAGRQRITEAGAVPLAGAPATYNSYQLSLNANWEIDFWGKIRRSTEAAKADLLSQEEARRAVIMTLVSNVAGGYVNLRSLDRQLDIARQTAGVRKDSLDIFQKRYDGGVVSDLELSQSTSEYQEALAMIPQIEQSIAQQENALCVLLGRNPSPIPRGKTLDELALPTIPAGIPSDLLERRPDIRRVEQNLVAANARIGAAKALYFPSISLTGLFGFASADLSDLFTGGAKVWNYTASLAAPIFTAGKIAGQVQSAEAVQKQALLSYLQTIQTAFQEVDNALVEQRKTRERLEAQGKQVAALRTSKRAASLRYDNGYSSYLEVLDAERSLFNADLSAAQTKGNVFRAFVSLYKAMGGGWIAVADGLTEPAVASTKNP